MSSRRPSPRVIQLDLLGAGSVPAQVHRLFFALLPDEVTRSRIEKAAAEVAAAQDLRMRMIRPARYHATLHFLGDHPVLREDIVNAAVAAADNVRAQPFELVLDGAYGFHGREPPCVLRCTQTPPALQALWQDLRGALLRAGLDGHLSRSFTPHVTYAYSRGAVPQPIPLEPIHWQVEGFSLSHSIVGSRDYQPLKAWRFQPS